MIPPHHVVRTGRIRVGARTSIMGRPSYPAHPPVFRASHEPMLRTAWATKAEWLTPLYLRAADEKWSGYHHSTFLATLSDGYKPPDTPIEWLPPLNLQVARDAAYLKARTYHGTHEPTVRTPWATKAMWLAPHYLHRAHVDAKGHRVVKPLKRRNRGLVALG